MSRDRDRKRNSLLGFDPVGYKEFLEQVSETVSVVSEELDGMARGVRPDPGDLERAFEGISVPDVGELHAETSVLPDGTDIDPAEADLLLDQRGNVVEASEQAADTAGELFEIAVDEGGEAATVVVDAGGETIEVVADVGGEAATAGGEVAAEAVVQVFAAALDA